MAMTKVIRHFVGKDAAQRWVDKSKEQKGFVSGNVYCVRGYRYAGMVTGYFTPEQEKELINGKHNYAD